MSEHACDLCGEPADDDGECFGCKSYLCERCMNLRDEPPMGFNHTVEDHRP
jgi:hypothetical protein